MPAESARSTGENKSCTALDILGCLVHSLDMPTETNATATLNNSKTGEVVRIATADELAASIEASERDGGHGAIIVDGLTCYVES